ncbi:MAG: hypothetical protein ACQEUZ_01650 [Pseudomonadota bacterium]
MKQAKHIFAAVAVSLLLAGSVGHGAKAFPLIGSFTFGNSPFVFTFSLVDRRVELEKTVSPN